MDGIRVRQINTGYGKPRFSKIEIRDIALAIGALTIAFTVIYRDVNLFSSDKVTNIICWVLTSFVLVTCSFLFHEFGHKFVAQKYGAWSEFRMFPLGLALCLITSVFGFLFAAPGAVYINGYIDDRTNGKISVAGPAVNLVIGAISVLLMAVIGTMPATNLNIILYNITYLLAHLNAFLAIFNLLPIGPLDGAKVLRWDPKIWIAMIALAAVLLFASMRL